MNIDELREAFTKEAEPAPVYEPPKPDLTRSIATINGAQVSVTLKPGEGFHVVALEYIQDMTHPQLEEWIHHLVREASFGYTDHDSWRNHSVLVKNTDVSNIVDEDGDIARITCELTASGGLADAEFVIMATAELAVFHLPFPVAREPEMVNGTRPSPFSGIARTFDMAWAPKRMPSFTEPVFKREYLCTPFPGEDDELRHIEYKIKLDFSGGK